MTELRITAGFLPLLDSLLLVIAREKGLAAGQGIDLALVRETSWANIRDRVSVGHFDVAHMLGPMPIAANLGLSPIAVPIVAPMTLGLGGNAVAVSTNLWQRMLDAGAPGTIEPGPAGAALRKVLDGGGPRPRFAVTHPHSGHNYELRYWLAASGIMPDRDVDMAILPPPLMADALLAGTIDGYCVGEPWNSAGVASGAGRIVTVKARLWALSPDKVLGASQRWAEQNPEALAALLRALYAASVWCADPANHAETAAILSGPAYLNMSSELILRGLSGRLEIARGEPVRVEDFYTPHAHSATFPWITHALWYYSQMVRWGDVTHSTRNAELAAGSYRPDLYRAAIAPFGASLPTGDRKALDASVFFDGRPFDPDALDAYVRRNL
ncbi:MAG TPA: CmpA/NrtA family ABC transporter substrate-binding protein [Devosia sp.]|nr:CmpA/NrtA family ABC transporter substrate-binding protein [Devosia sp.]